MNRVLRTAARLAPLLGPTCAAALYGRVAASLARWIPARHVIRANRAYFGLPGAGGERDAAVIGHFAAYLGEFLGAAGDPDRVREVVTEIDLVALDQAAATGRGIVIVTPHFGNWEMGALAIEHHRPGMLMIIRTTGDPVLDAFIRRARGCELVDAAHSVKPMTKALRSGLVVAVAIDEPRERGIEVQFLGRVVRYPETLFRTIAETGSIVLCARCRRLRPGRIRVEASAPVMGAGPAATAQAVADVFAAWIREDPDQWTMFSPFSV